MANNKSTYAEFELEIIQDMKITDRDAAKESGSSQAPGSHLGIGLSQDNHNLGQVGYIGLRKTHSQDHMWFKQEGFFILDIPK